MAKLLSEGAKQLHEYMLSQRQHEFFTEGHFQVRIIFQAPTNFTATYKIYLDELHSAGMIKYHGSERFLLGFGIVQEALFTNGVDSSTERAELLASRYRPSELEIINEALKQFGLLRSTRQLTLRQTILELEYYSRFPVQTVIDGLNTYLMLPPEKQHGERYAQGIIRGVYKKAVESVAPVLTKPSNSTPKQPLMGLQKQEWIRAHLDQERFVLMNSAEQTEYLLELELDYEEESKSLDNSSGS